jgi:hypothetical protein
MKKLDTADLTYILGADAKQLETRFSSLTLVDTQELFVFLKANIKHEKDLVVANTTKTNFITAINTLLAASTRDNEKLLLAFPDRTQFFTFKLTTEELADLSAAEAKLPVSVVEQIRQAKNVKVAPKYAPLINHIKLSKKRVLAEPEEQPPRVAYLFFNSKGFTVTNDEELLETISVYVAAKVSDAEAEFKTKWSDAEAEFKTEVSRLSAKLSDAETEFKALLASHDTMEQQYKEEIAKMRSSRVEPHVKTLAEKKVSACSNAQGIQQKFKDLNMLTGKTVGDKDCLNLINKI